MVSLLCLDTDWRYPVRTEGARGKQVLQKNGWGSLGKCWSWSLSWRWGCFPNLCCGGGVSRPKPPKARESLVWQISDKSRRESAKAPKQSAIGFLPTFFETFQSPYKSPAHQDLFRTSSRLLGCGPRDSSYEVGEIPTPVKWILRRKLQFAPFWSHWAHSKEFFWARSRTCENRTCEDWPSTLSCTFSWSLSQICREHSLGSLGKDPVVRLTQKASTFVGISVDIFVYAPVCVFASTFVREFVCRISWFACSVPFWSLIFLTLLGLTTQTQNVGFSNAKDLNVNPGPEGILWEEIITMLFWTLAFTTQVCKSKPLLGPLWETFLAKTRVVERAAI